MIEGYSSPTSVAANSSVLAASFANTAYNCTRASVGPAWPNNAATRLPATTASMTRAAKAVDIGSWHVGQPHGLGKRLTRQLVRYFAIHHRSGLACCATAGGAAATAGERICCVSSSSLPKRGGMYNPSVNTTTLNPSGGKIDHQPSRRGSGRTVPVTGPWVITNTLLAMPTKMIARNSR